MYTMQADGSIIIGDDFVLTSNFLRMWKQDKENARRFVLKFPECPRRQLTVIKKPCGRCIADYSCNLKGIQVSPSICEACLENPIKKQLPVDI